MAVKLGNGNWAVKENKLLAYNDNSGRFFNKEFDFARGSSATYVGKDGLIKSAASDVPRIDFSDSTNGALLLEGQSTNLIPYSEDFSNGWALDDATIVSNSATSPDGALNATLLKGNTNSSRHNLVTSGQASNTGTFSIFVKAKELKYVQIASANTVQQYVNFDLSNGIIGTVGSSFSNAKIENYGNGWYRCIVVSANQFNGFYFSLVNGLNATWLESWVMPNNTDGLYIYGFQLEQNSVASSYIPSQGSATTRLADVCNNSGSAQDFNSEEGVLYAEIAALANDSYRFISLSDGTNNNNVRLNLSPIANQISFEANSGGSLQLGYTNNNTNVLLNTKICINFKLNDFSVWINGIKVHTDTNGIAPIGLNTLNFDRGTGTNLFYGNVKNIQVFTEAKSDEFLAALTTI